MHLCVSKLVYVMTMYINISLPEKLHQISQLTYLPTCFFVKKTITVLVEHQEKEWCVIHKVHTYFGWLIIEDKYIKIYLSQIYQHLPCPCPTAHFPWHFHSISEWETSHPINALQLFFNQIENYYLNALLHYTIDRIRSSSWLSVPRVACMTGFIF